MEQFATLFAPILLAALSTVGAALLAVITWLALKMVSRVESIEEKMGDAISTLNKTIAGIETRLSIVEEKVRIQHMHARYDDEVGSHPHRRYTDMEVPEPIVERDSLRPTSSSGADVLAWYMKKAEEE